MIHLGCIEKKLAPGNHSVLKSLDMKYSTINMVCGNPKDTQIKQNMYFTKNKTHIKQNTHFTKDKTQIKQNTYIQKEKYKTFFHQI